MPGRLIVTGAMPRCGKTAATAGIAGALLESGLRVQAAKPLGFKDDFGEGTDQRFLDRVTRAMQTLDQNRVPSAYEVTPIIWNRALEACRNLVYPALIEAPDTAAAPLFLDGSHVRTAVDLADQMRAPMLLVVRKHERLYAETTPVMAYLNSQEASVIGWLAVETRPDPCPHWDTEMLLLSREYQMTCLGVLPYSPSIATEREQQGNVIRLTQDNIDMLPVLEGLRIELPAGKEP